jgi:probable F420-dependent oxidoreductase
MTRPFRFAASIRGPVDHQRLIQTACQAESLGYASLLNPDHLLDQAAPLLALTAVAQATSRLRLGTLVLNNDLRHPAVLAQELATLDHLSDGRLEIGLGAGWNVDEYVQAGLPFDAHAVRFARMVESFHILQGLFADGPFSYSGEHYRITDMDGRPKPVQRPHPPFLFGGGGKRVLTFAAQHAQIIGFAPRLPAPGKADLRSVLAEATLEKVGWVRDAAGDRFDQLELNTYPCLGPVRVTDDARGAARELSDSLREEYGEVLTEDELLDSPHVFYGTIDQLVEKCLGLRERFGITYIMVVGDHLAFAPVVEQLAGM